MNYPVILNIILVQIGWFACVLGTAYEIESIGLCTFILVIGTHLFFIQNRIPELRNMFVAAMIGLINESFLINLDVYTPKRWFMPEMLSPLWLILLWVNISIAFNGCLMWLKKKYLIAPLLAAAGGSLAFWAGENLGALVLNDNLLWSYSVLTISWAIVFPLLLWIVNKIESYYEPTFDC